MATTLIGTKSVSFQRSQEGERVYTLVSRVRSNDPANDGPATVFNTPGLPQVGSVWQAGNDYDAWAFCTPEMTINPTQQKEGEPIDIWEVTNKFSTIARTRCQDNVIEDPLLEPDRISGGYVKYTEEKSFDKDGNPIVNSGYEFLKGPAVEFDANRPTVRISQNVLDLELDQFSQMIDHVNSNTLWGLGPRKIKLSNITWERLLYGTCSYYYVRTFDFDINFQGFDRTVLDEGRRIIAGYWETETDMEVGKKIVEPPNWIIHPWADANNPSHFQEYKDINGEPSTLIYSAEEQGSVWSGFTTGSGSGSDSPSTVSITYYSEADFTQLGIPTFLG